MPDGTYFNHPGVVITVAAGDDKAYVGGSSPSFPADLPDVVSVGGTDVTKQAGVWKSTVWNDSGAGCSTLFEAQPWQKEVPDWTQVGCGTKRSENDDAAVADPYTGVAVLDKHALSEPGGPDRLDHPRWDLGRLAHHGSGLRPRRRLPWDSLPGPDPLLAPGQHQ